MWTNEESSFSSGLAKLPVFHPRVSWREGTEKDKVRPT